ncbi:MAG: DUF5716 family protein [Lachnospiraceae bacterium]
MTNGSIIGYDMNDIACQISYYDEEQQEPETLEAAVDNYQIPLIISKQKDDWVIGKEAKKAGITKTGHAISKLFSKSLTGDKIEFGGESYDAIWLLCQFVYQSLKQFQKIEMLIFCVPIVNEDVAKMLKGLAHILKMDKGNIFVQDYKESFCNYMIYQPKELWQYETALFYCDRNEVRAYMLRKLEKLGGNGKGPYVTVDAVARAEMAELAFVYPVLNVETAKEADERFRLFIESVFDKKNISSVFLTGDGFENNWYPNSLRVLCNGRRAFLGNNLYSKGACYAAYRKSIGRVEGPVYLDENKLLERICLKMRNHGKEEWYPIVSWGSHWYEADGQWEVLLEDTEDIEVHIESLLSKEVRIENISLDGLPERTSYSIRLNIEILFIDQSTCKLILKDIGLGEIFPATDFYVERIIQLGGANGKFNSLS